MTILPSKSWSRHMHEMLAVIKKGPMKFRAIVGLLIVLIVCSCSQRTSKNGLHNDIGTNQHHESKSGLRIENSPNRGLNYTDTLGTKYSYRNIPITITNDSTIAIHIQIALSNEYDYPAAYDDQKFKVFLLPKELTPDKVTWNSVSYELGYNELHNFFDRGLNPAYVLNETLEPGEKCFITMGTLYPRPTDSFVLPHALFVQGDSVNFQACDNTIDQDGSTDPELAIGLKLDFNRGESNESCILIPCGQIYYLEY